MKSLKRVRKLLVQTYSEFLDDKGFKMAAALSYYSAFSIGPLLMIAIAIAGFIFGEDAARGEIHNQLNYLIGRDGAAMVETILKGASDKSTGILAAVISVIILILGALGVFIELRESLNIIWGVEPKPGEGIRGFLKTRLVSFSMVVATGFLLIVSLVINAVVNLLANYFSDFLGFELTLAEILNIVSSFIVISILLSMIFKFLPDALIGWKYVWYGSIITSILFTAGKYFIGLYLGNSSYSSTYGAAASLIVLLIWIYYSGVILFLGAEFTYIFRLNSTETELKADNDGIKIKKISQLVKEAMKTGLH